jgi:hypothetical protein
VPCGFLVDVVVVSETIIILSPHQEQQQQQPVHRILSGAGLCESWGLVAVPHITCPTFLSFDYPHWLLANDRICIVTKTACCTFEYQHTPNGRRREKRSGASNSYAIQASIVN